MRKLITAVLAPFILAGAFLMGTSAAYAATETYVPAPWQFDDCGTANDRFVYGNKTALNWSAFKTSSGSWKVTATAKDGYTIPTGVQRQWVFPAFTDVCRTISGTLPKPTQLDKCGPTLENPQDVRNWSLPEVVGVDYAVAVDGRSVSAYAEVGYRFAAGVITTWTYPAFTTKPC